MEFFYLCLLFIYKKKHRLCHFQQDNFFLVLKSECYCQRERKKILAVGSVLVFHGEGIFCLFQNVKLVANDVKIEKNVFYFTNLNYIKAVPNLT